MFEIEIDHLTIATYDVTCMLGTICDLCYVIMLRRRLFYFIYFLYFVLHIQREIEALGTDAILVRF